MGSFDFSLTQRYLAISHRNQMLIDKKVIQPLKYKKTGTTIVGLKFDNGVLLAADTRATAGSIVAEKNC
jgi:20S proteasome subunit beta 2